MTQVDSRIAMGVQPLDVGGAIGKGYQLRDLAAQADERKLDNQMKQQAFKKQGTLADLHRLNTQGGKLNREGLAQGMADAGYGADVAGMQKQHSDAERAQAEYFLKNHELIQKRIDSSGQMLGAMLADPGVNQQKIISGISRLVHQGMMTPEEGAEAARGLPGDDPGQLRAYLEERVMRGVQAKDMLAEYRQKMEAVNLGGHTQMVDMNARTNPGIAGRTFQRSATIGEQESARHNRAAEGLTARGQSMVDARSRESNAAAMSKPFEVTGEDGKPMLVQQDKAGNIRPVQGYAPKTAADKPLTDSQSKALLFGSRMQEAGKVLQALEQSGTTTSVPGSRAGGGVGAVLNFFSPAQQQQLNQAKRDFLNAVLRRESGAVIADSEFDNGDKQYFPQPGDSKDVIAQKARNRQNATSLILREVPEKQRGESGSSTANGKSAASSIDALLKKYE